MDRFPDLLGNSFLREVALEFALFGNFFGTRLFGNNFEKKLWGIIAGSNFAALQQHCRIVALKNDSFGEEF